MPHPRGSRVALHLVGVTVLTAGSVVLTGAAGHASGAARPDSYGGAATASALHFMADRNPQPTPVTDLFHAELPYATSALDSSGEASATAAAIYPGAGLLGIGGLLCQAGACLPLPDYPVMTTASYPTRPDAQAQSSPGSQQLGPLSVTPNLTVAHADPNRVDSRTVATGLGVEGVATAEGAVTHTTQAFEGSTLVVTAETTVTGLDLGGGQLHIDQLRSVAVSHVDGEKVTTASAVSTVTGATAGGTPVTIDSEGVHVAGNGDGGAGLAGANTALAALEAAGLDVRLLVPTREVKDGSASASTGGLLVTFAHTVDQPALPGAPVSVGGDYVGSLSFGGAGVTAFASPAFDVDVPWVDVPPPTDVLPPPATSPVAAPALPGTAPGTQVTTGTGSGPVVAQPGVRPRPAAVLGVDLTNERLRVLAMVLLGYPALVLLAAPLRARPRRTRRT